MNCSAHILQLCIADGFKNNMSIDRALGAARKLVGHFHHSALKFSCDVITRSRLQLTDTFLVNFVPF